MISIWWALFFMFLGGAIVDWYNWRSWKLYQRGRNENNRDGWRPK